MLHNRNLEPSLLSSEQGALLDGALLAMLTLLSWPWTRDILAVHKSIIRFAIGTNFTYSTNFLLVVQKPSTYQVRSVPGSRSMKGIHHERFNAFRLVRYLCPVY